MWCGGRGGAGGVGGGGGGGGGSWVTAFLFFFHADAAEHHKSAWPTHG